MTPRPPPWDSVVVDEGGVRYRVPTNKQEVPRIARITEDGWGGGGNDDQGWQEGSDTTRPLWDHRNILGRY
jgi:hypothetical protein